MGRPLRTAPGGFVYHVLNRANARLKIFTRDREFEAFEGVLAEAIERVDMRLLAYCLMPNHWHLVLWPHDNGDLSRFMGWLTLTHTQRWHADQQTSGSGHLYQGRFRSFPVMPDGHDLNVCRYVERNPVRAGLVRREETWRWGSLWRREQGEAKRPRPLSTGPVRRPPGWVQQVKQPLTPRELEALRRCVNRGQPSGDPDWQSRTAAKLGLESTFRYRGRPRKT